jgi:hypothetical protein
MSTSRSNTACKQEHYFITTHSILHAFLLNGVNDEISFSYSVKEAIPTTDYFKYYINYPKDTELS